MLSTLTDTQATQRTDPVRWVGGSRGIQMGRPAGASGLTAGSTPLLSQWARVPPLENGLTRVGQTTGWLPGGFSPKYPPLGWSGSNPQSTQASSTPGFSALQLRSVCLSFGGWTWRPWTCSPLCGPVSSPVKWTSYFVRRVWGPAHPSRRLAHGHSIVGASTLLST